MLIANNVFMSLFFTCLLLLLIRDTRNLSQQTSQQCLSTVNMVFSDEDKILIITHKQRNINTLSVQLHA